MAASAQAFNIEGAIRIQTAQAKAALVDLRGDLVTTTTTAKKAAAETANAAKAPLAILSRPAPVDFSAQLSGGAAAAQSQAAFRAAVTGANAAITAQSAAVARAAIEAQTHRAAIEALRAQFVPAAAAAQQYEKALVSISAAEEMGAITAKEAAVIRRQAAAEMDAVGKASAGAAGGLRGFGMQLNQVATVGGMTGDWMSALAIQLPDMLMAFGTVGVFAGVAAGALMPFISALADGADKGKTLTDANDRLADSIERARTSAATALGSLDDLRQKYGQVDGEVRQLIETQAAYDKAMAARALRDAKTAMAAYVAPGSFSSSQAYRPSDDAGLDPAIGDRIVQIQELRKELGLSAEEAVSLNAQFDRLSAASDAGQMADAYAAIRAEIAAAYGGVEALALSTADGADKARNLYEQAAKAEGAAREFAGINMAAGVAAASEEARQLAAFLGMSIERANTLSGAAKKAGALGFGLDVAADPIYGGAKKLTFGPDPGDSRDGIRDLTVPPAKRQGRGGRSDAERAADRAERQRERDAERVADFAADLRAEIEGYRELDPVQKEIIRNREVLDKAGPEQRTYLEGLIRQKVETQSLAAAWDEAGASMYDALDGMILKGQSAGEVMESLAGSVAQLLLRASLLGDGPLAGVFGFSGGGLIGMGISALTGGGAATGGTVTPFLDLVKGSYASGGWTGGTDPSAVAGVVHAREYVFDAASTARIGVKALDALRAGRLPGYRDGGYVSGGAVPSLQSGPAPALSSQGAAAAGGSLTMNLTVRVEGANGDAQIIAMVQQGVSQGVSQALSDYDRHVLPVRVGQITADPRSIG